MDVLVRLPLIFVTDLMFANRACSDLFPGFQYVSSLLPMDPVHMWCILCILMSLVENVKELYPQYALMFLWFLYDQVFYAFHWVVGLNPENYFLELFLKFSFISIVAYAFKRLSEASELVTLMAALFLYCYLEENPTRMVNYVKYALITLFYVIICFDAESEVDENVKFMLDPDSVVFKRACQKFGLYWVITVAAQPLTWFGSSEWNLWNGIVAEGMSTPIRVCAMTTLLLTLTYYAFKLFEKLGFGRRNSTAMMDAISMTTQFFAFVLSDRVWDLEPEQRAESIQIYLLAHLVLFLKSCYDDAEFFLFLSNPEDDIYIQRSKKMKAWILFILTFLILIYLLYFAWSTLELNARSLILFTSITQLILRLSIFIISISASRCARWFSYNCNERWIDIVFIVSDCNYYLKQLLISLCTVWMTVFHAVRLPRMIFLFYFIKNDLVEVRTIYRKHTQPKTCLRSLPRASAEQLAANDDICLVCHEDMEEACVTPCSHYYHPECLLKWLYGNTKCPLCRTVLYEV